jgi:N-acyl-L-homoserine lactone synthetase
MVNSYLARNTVATLTSSKTSPSAAKCIDTSRFVKAGVTQYRQLTVFGRMSGNQDQNEA